MTGIAHVPNLLTGYRFLVAPLLVFCLYPGAEMWVRLVGFILYTTAAFTDLADGYIARKYQVESVLGKLMDPLADKVLVAAALVMLIPLGRMPAWVAFVILSRELIVTGLRGVAASSGLVISASKLGKWKSVIQLIALGTLMFPAGVLPIPYLHQIGLVLLYIALLLTIWSGIDYFYRFKKVYIVS
ncbi:MAG: CDP-diacylglycerol--glycerol-3-phosphate 3-phosphatidyltransferase [Desulfobulbaceae bacterium]|nr:CDP-diacylglycerol--glycerol-3-phosphate 3-phosphatidyltransferase [Desulfobulbaceae bacterium]